MIRRLVDHWVDFMIKNGADEGQRQVYAYGLECVMNEMASDVLLLICACFLERIWEMAVWIIVFNMLRINTGGYHAPTPFLCITGSTILGILCTVVYPALVGRRVLGVIICAACICIVIRIAPVLNARHPVLEHRKQTARRRAVLLSILAAAASFFPFSSQELSAVIWISMCSVVLLSVAGCRQNKK